MLIPGMLGGFLSAILAAINSSLYTYTSSSNAELTTQTGRTESSNGAWQLLGMALSLGIGALAGLFIGIFYKCFNRNDADDQFDDAANYKLHEQPIPPE